MKRVIFHIGPHKTGSSYIQRMMKVNADKFPETHEPILKNNPLFGALHNTMLSLHTDADVDERLPLIADIANELAKNVQADHTLFSDEDLMGALPTRHSVPGLYPFAPRTLATLQQTFAAHGMNVQFYHYMREYGDWMRSLHAFKFRNHPRPFAPRKFAERHKLPKNWLDHVERMDDALGFENIQYQSYEEDRATGRFGTALWRAFGLSDDVLDSFDWIDPVNVSRPETVDPKNW